MSYNARMSSSAPGLILIMIDRSSSMEENYGQQAGGQTRAEFAAMAVNKVIYEIIMANQSGTKIRDRCFLAVIGYGEEVEMLQAGMLQEMANNSLRIETLTKDEKNSAGHTIQTTFDMPIWIESKASALTPMAEAFATANKAITEWIRKYPENAAPVVINITDGMPNDKDSAKAEAQQLMQLATTDGNVLLFNAHIGEEGGAVDLLPNNMGNLSNAYSEFLFDISSEIPLNMYPAATKSGFNPQPGARGLVTNANADTLVRLLNFGSSGATGTATGAANTAGERYI